jgi:hypothetical protein
MELTFYAQNTFSQSLTGFEIIKKESFPMPCTFPNLYGLFSNQPWSPEHKPSLPIFCSTREKYRLPYSLL